MMVAHLVGTTIVSPATHRATIDLGFDMNATTPALALVTHATPIAWSNDQLFAVYAPLVDRVARRVGRRLPAGSTLEHEDLVAAGTLGLIEAAERFDWANPADFERFAEFRIKGAMLDELRRFDPVPTSVRRQVNAIETTRRRIERNEARCVGDDELAHHVGLSGARLAELLAAAPPARIDLSEHDAPTQAPTPYDVAAARDILAALNAAITDLDDRRRTIITGYYLREEALTDIAETLGISVGRASQIKSSALQQLADAMRAALRGVVSTSLH